MQTRLKGGVKGGPQEDEIAKQSLGTGLQGGSRTILGGDFGHLAVRYFP
jgi:hypothetical protein